MIITRRAVAAAGFAAIVPTRARAQAAGFAAAAAYSAERRGVAMLVMQAGQVVFEDYPGPGAPDSGWELASGTKSFCGVMAAAAVQDGLLRLDEPCAETLAEWRADPDKSRITIRELLTLTGGVGSGRLGRPPTYADAVAAPLSSPPGTAFQYGPTPFQVFGEIMRRKLAARRMEADPLAYLQRRIFSPIGVAPLRWRRGADGMPHLPSGAALTARDWGRFGSFVLAGGRHGGQALVDPTALAANFEPTALNPGYGLTWWLLRPGMRGPGPRSGIPANAALAAAAGLDVRMAGGAGDQRLYLLPERDMLIVRQSDAVLEALTGRGPDWSDARFLTLALGG